jgi:anti-anti-sigma regulatory factor
LTTRQRSLASLHIIVFDEQRAVLWCSGDEDRCTQGHRRGAFARALRAPADVAVDMGELCFADPSLMLDLAMLARRLRHRGRQVLIRGAQPQIATLIERTGLHRLEGVCVLAPAAAA